MRFLQRSMYFSRTLTTLRPQALGWMAAALLAAGCQTQPTLPAASAAAVPGVTNASAPAPASPAPAPLLGAGLALDSNPTSLLHASTLAPHERPEHVLDWVGTYQAIFPCNGCRGVAISVQLRADHTAVVRERRVGEPHDGTITPSFVGSFHFSSSHPNLIALTEPGISLPAYHFWVSEGWIELRDRRTGQRLSANDTFRMPKTSAAR